MRGGDRKGMGLWAAVAVAAWAALAHPTAAALPPSTTAVLNDVWTQLGGAQWSRCQWSPGDDPCAAPVGAYIGTQTTVQVCFICQRVGNTTRLVGVNLEKNRMTGTLPRSIGNLTWLQGLEVGGNALTGEIPREIGALGNLQSLGLDDNQFTGQLPLEIFALTRLTSLVVSGNGLTGAIPAAVGNLARLEVLMVGFNAFSGPLPASLNALTQLRALQGDNNRFTSLPDSLAGLTLLEQLRFAQNALIGALPSWLATLTRLQYLYLNNNALTGSLPSGLGNLTALRVLSVYGNQLTGQIPPDIGAMAQLEWLFLSNNGLTGVIPTEIGQMTRLTQVDIASCQCTGPIPASIGTLAQLVFLNLNENAFTSTPDSIGNLTLLQYLYLNNNELTGEVSGWLGSLTRLEILALNHNHLTGPLPPSLGNFGGLQALIASNNMFSGTIPQTLGGLRSLQKLVLDNNQLHGPIPPSLGNLANLTECLLNNNLLSGVIPESLGMLTSLTFLDLSMNVLTGPLPGSLGNMTALVLLWAEGNALTGPLPASLGRLSALMQLILTNNFLTGQIPDSFGNLSTLMQLQLGNNSLSTALVTAPRLFEAFQGEVYVDLSYNNISTVGPVLSGCQNGFGSLSINLAGNLIDDNSFQTLLFSADQCARSLSLFLHGNLITAVPPNLLNYTVRTCGFRSCHRVIMSLTIDLSGNPLTSVAASAFDAPLSPGLTVASTVETIVVDLSYSTAALVVPDRFNFFDIPWNREQQTTTNVDVPFILVLSGNPGIPLTVARALSSGYNPPPSVGLSLAYNGYTAVPPLVFADTALATIDLSSNNITEVASDAFGYNFRVWRISLSHNLVSQISVELFNAIPGLMLFSVDHNNLIALPQSNNHINSVFAAAGNPLTCQSYGPVAQGCVCNLPGYTLSFFCGYVRCFPDTTPDGCPVGEVFNSSDCSNAPASTCVHGTVTDQFFQNGAFHPITQCRAVSALTGVDAYEVRAPQTNAKGTATSDRICSLCSTCPSGYHTTQCTETTNTKCTQLLSPAAMVAIILAVVLLALGVALGIVYGRAQKRQRYQTQTELELTERLLGNVQEEKDRATEEIAVMEQAWIIAETDLKFGDVIGEGGYGMVYSGSWGHISVAIKVLHRPLDDMNPTLRTQFDAEVKFMRSIRHPHILIFYGAGVDHENRAFLVTELMRGSLGALLLDHSQPIDWGTRLTFACDIAAGMAYLHDRGTVHRDLKADNCFLSDSNRVKVADFGTGRIAKQIQDTAANAPSLSSFADGSWTRLDASNSSRTLSKGVGSLFWMAPEALRGSRLKTGQAPALDVYSYGIVLWEIWARELPWNEINEKGIRLSSKLIELVDSGVRPSLPEGSISAPGGYSKLMKHCWDERPERRPSAAVVLESLDIMSRSFRGNKSSESAL